MCFAKEEGEKERSALQNRLSFLSRLCNSTACSRRLQAFSKNIYMNFSFSFTSFPHKRRDTQTPSPLVLCILTHEYKWKRRGTKHPLMTQTQALHTQTPVHSLPRRHEVRERIVASRGAAAVVSRTREREVHDDWKTRNDFQQREKTWRA